jgi:hypothetical protein
MKFESSNYFTHVNRVRVRKKLMSPTHKNRSLSDIETDLMNCLLKAPTIDYPWNPADPDTADYYARSDCHFCLENWSDAELTARSESYLIW